ncbi:MAG: hypothetical protein BZY87_03750 [SAR202 cluster bacterium Io17-Chloro-G6]|nr:MAG: hypothetical protein BZY87_03750 [SAR202 cluster bacterium Io17-Chloro-G6]
MSRGTYVFESAHLPLLSGALAGAIMLALLGVWWLLPTKYDSGHPLFILISAYVWSMVMAMLASYFAEQDHKKPWWLESQLPSGMVIVSRTTGKR